jgi:Serine carboxypeptidase
VSSVIFVDSPVGTGFSYSNTAEGLQTSDTKTVHQLLSFLYKVCNFSILESTILVLFYTTKIVAHIKETNITSFETVSLVWELCSEIAIDSSISSLMYSWMNLKISQVLISKLTKTKMEESRSSLHFLTEITK